jgi:hypothetical protein
LWYGKKPNLQHLRVFGCKAYVHIPDQKRPKLDAKSLPCIFIGYSDISKAYRFFDPASHCVHESRDAIFDESSVKSHSPDHRVEWEDLLLDQSDDPDSSREVVVQRDDRSDAIIVDNNDDSDDSDDPASASDVSDVSDSDEKDSDSSRASSSSDASDVDEDVPLAPSSLPQPQPQPQSDVSLRRSTRVRVPPIPYWDVQ